MRLTTLAAICVLVGCQGDNMRYPPNFFMKEDGSARFGPTDLADTKFMLPNPQFGRGQQQKFLNINVPDQFTQPVTITFRSEYTVGQRGPGGALIGGFAEGTPFLGYPLVGFVKWGTGAAYQQIEFDIPSPKLPAGPGSAAAGSLPPANFPEARPVLDTGAGISLTIAGSAFEVQVRHDGNLPWLVDPGAADRIGEFTPAKVMVNLGPAVGDGSGPLRRVIFVCGTGLAAHTLAPGASVLAPIPPFTKRIWVMRQPIDQTPVDLAFNDSIGGNLRFRPVPVNSEGPVEVHPQDNNVRLFNRGAVAIDDLQLVYDVNPN